MTTFQEPQPQSRRAVRQSERGDAPDPAAGFTPFSPPSAAPTPQSYAAPVQPVAPGPQAAQPVFDPTPAREMWDTTARRAAPLPTAVPSSEPAPAPGRRSAGAAAAPVAEPLTYATQARPVTPITDAPTMRARANAPARPSVEPEQAQPAAQLSPAPQSEQQSYRVRDFSPEARRAEPAVAPAWAPQQPQPSAPADLQYRTEVRAPEPALVAPAAPIAPQLEQTLTRRELRVLQQAEEAAALRAGAQTPASVPAQPQSQSQAPPDPQAPAQQQTPAQALSAPDAPMAWPFGDRAPQPAPSAGLSAAVTEFDALARPLAPQPLVQPPVVQPQYSTQAPVQPTQQYAEPVIPAAAAAAPTPVAMQQDAPQWSPPPGHWSVQPGLDDETQPVESTINRTVGSGTITTSALVLPTAPQGSDIRGPLTGTGEIMLTGSIDLPLAFSSTGATSRIEHDSMDALFDMHDAEAVATDSAPVRAIMAVSTHNTGQGVMHTQKPKGTRALTALIVVASSMAVLVVGLLFVAITLNVF
jgi:hypothetical protein